MTDVTQEMILEYILRKGGVVKNVDLVRHFKKYLQVEDPRLKGNLTIAHTYTCVHLLHVFDINNDCVILCLVDICETKLVVGCWCTYGGVLLDA